MKIYTRTGDDGTTGLFGGKRVPKDDPRVEAYGTVDEMNCQIGLARAEALDPEIDLLLEKIQSELFALGADLATPAGAKAGAVIRRFRAEDSVWLEEAIDRIQATTPKIESFVLPGGCRQGATVHVARAICRRAERAVVRLSRSEPIEPAAIIYLNRLSDLLFVLARAINHRAGAAEDSWNP